MISIDTNLGKKNMENTFLIEDYVDQRQGSTTSSILYSIQESHPLC